MFRLRHACAAALLAAAASPCVALAVAAEGANAADRTVQLYLPLALVPMAAAPVHCEVAHGHYDAPFGLPLSSATSGGTIRYTADGSVPTETNGMVYDGPVPIVTTTVIRAATFAPGRPPSPPTTCTYIFAGDVASQDEHSALARGLPPTWGNYPDNEQNAGEGVVARYGVNAGVAGDPVAFRAALLSLPTVSIAGSIEDIFGRSGIYSNSAVKGEERAASVEWLPGAAGGPSFQVDCGLRIAGGWSRRKDVSLKHSFSLRFRERYGAARLDRSVIPGAGVSSFDVLRLRAGQADAFYFSAHRAQYLHDQWARDTQRDMGWLSPGGAFVHLYVNGLYWGVYNLAEEPTASFMADHVGGDEGDWDVIKEGGVVGGEWVPEVEDGNDAAFEAMRGILREQPAPRPDEPADRARYERLAQMLDIPQHIDYTLIQIYGANTDWPGNNWRMARDRAGGAGFQTFVWDFEHTTALHDDPARGFCLPEFTDPVTGECGFNADTAGVIGLHGWLRRFPDYRLAFADRALRHLGPGGALSPAAAATRYAVLADAVAAAIAGEAARWGTARPQAQTEREQLRVWRDFWARFGLASQTPAQWLQERDRLLSDYFPARSAIVLRQLCREKLVPPVVAPVFASRVEGGDDTTILEMGPGTFGCPDASRAGTIYYTLDGSDPRARWTDAVGASARAYAAPVILRGFARVRARLLGVTEQGRQWGPLTEATFGEARVALSEIMYHPPEAEAEFLELVNLESVAADVSGIRLGEAVTFTVPAGTELEPGGHLVIARDLPTFRAAYPGVSVVGTYDGKLDNAGETIVVRTAAGRELQRITYDDGGLWPLAPDGRGYSLVPYDAGADNDDPDRWRASAAPGGSPGARDAAPPYGEGRVVVNEVLAHPGANQEGAIELHNPASVRIDLEGWGISDDIDLPWKYVLPPGSVLAPGAYLVLYSGAFRGGPGGGFDLAPGGGTLYLASFDAEGVATGYLQATAYGAGEAGVSFGRTATVSGAEIVALSRPTFGVDAPESIEAFREGAGAPNAAPWVAPVVLNEIMYAPPRGGDEFIELHNRTDAVVALEDPVAPAQPWAFLRGVTFAFPRGTTIAPGGYLLIVAVDPQAFRARHGVPSDVAILGPYAGKLDNAGEDLELSRAWSRAPDRSRVVVDHVRYRPRAPWPSAAAGTGASLERIDPARHGNDPLNWAALTDGGTPGRPNGVPSEICLPWVTRWF